MVAIIAGLELWASAGYLYAVLRGTARPRLASWGIWAISMGIAAAGALSAGQMGSAALAGTGSLTAAAILVAGWAAGSREVALLDRIGLWVGGAGIAILAVALFIPVAVTAAVAVSVVTDLAAFAPTWLNGARGPEPLGPYALLTTAACVAMASASTGAVASQIFPLYEILACGTMCLIILSRRKAEQAPASLVRASPR